MNNKINFSTIVIILLLGLLGACSYEDKTTYADDFIPEIKIDTTGIPKIHTIAREDTLIILPSVSREGNSSEDFEYEWWITLKPGNDFKVSKVVGREETLRYIVEEAPEAFNYSLWYRVTDKTTGLMSGIMWEVKVEASSGQGLVVAYTEDGTTTDFALIQDSLFTTDYYEKGTRIKKQTSYRFNRYSKQNGKKFDGVVQWMFAQTRKLDNRSTYMLHGASKNNVFCINSMDFSIVMEGKENFYDPYIELDIDFYALCHDLYDFYPVISNKGRLYGLDPNQSNIKFGIDMQGEYTSNSYISDYYYLTWFDSANGQFYSICSDQSWNEEPFLFIPTTPDFYPQNLQGAEVLAAGQARNEHCFLIKKGGKIGLYTLAKSDWSPFLTSYYIDITDAPGIERATSFAFTSLYEDMIYYSADNIVNGINYSRGNARYIEGIYNPGEKIEFITMLRRTGGKLVPFDDRCLLVVTNGDNGKIHAVKLNGGNSGEYQDVTVLEGFRGRITAVAVQD